MRCTAFPAIGHNTTRTARHGPSDRPRLEKARLRQSDCHDSGNPIAGRRHGGDPGGGRRLIAKSTPLPDRGEGMYGSPEFHPESMGGRHPFSMITGPGRGGRIGSPTDRGPPGSPVGSTGGSRTIPEMAPFWKKTPSCHEASWPHAAMAACQYLELWSCRSGHVVRAAGGGDSRPAAPGKWPDYHFQWWRFSEWRSGPLSGNFRFSGIPEFRIFENFRNSGFLEFCNFRIHALPGWKSLSYFFAAPCSRRGCLVA